MTSDEIAHVEGLVNGWIADASATTTAVMDLKDARAAGATAMFGEKYEDVVRVVEVPGVSMELCGGADALCPESHILAASYIKHTLFVQVRICALHLCIKAK